MLDNEKEIRVFYSWQSDLPDKTNRNAIRTALRAAAKDLSSAIIVDEATRDTAGSPNIPTTIIDKIDLADIFVADVTTINGTATAGRKCPNPNVVYELGYAVATLGWDRVILLFNTEHGVFPNDLPFDFDRHRASPFRLTHTAGSREKKAIRDLAKMALDAIIKKDPKRPSELRGLSRSQIEHNRDVETLRWVLNTLHLPTLDQHINELPRCIHDRVFFFHESFQSVLSSNSLFHLNDEKLWDVLGCLCRAWTDTLSYAGNYHDTPSGKVHIFTNPMDMPLTGPKEKVWEAIDQARRDMRKALDEVLRRVREDYVEIDLHETNAKAHADYIEFQQEVEG